MESMPKKAQHQTRQSRIMHFITTGCDIGSISSHEKIKHPWRPPRLGPAVAAGLRFKYSDKSQLNPVCHL
ncbi:MAG TPA: hypothetical protein DCR17_06005 [Verrucomicrobiales bacterium]|nr:hypothetical protein [Pedosphaera sp.]HAO66221.1 hypothetical protein [Verrucomicrobiales bacterium]HAQ98672.1 hypothetical protein [Verrucomicrobiales bacterium]HAW01987.1 hypothetical protein [Verrucomicrobiales bacterium]HBP56718.1 hypothetical protein [Verrucomicrobiales bacterium]|tara:strand:- start:13 stop:222 length:210 start_codon:yes stop_codon:yes gene_type:complete